VSDQAEIKRDDRILTMPTEFITIILNKPRVYVSSRDGQGSKTIYDLLPRDLHHLKPIGRLDKDTSGIILLTSNGELAFSLSHPKFNKEKVYNARLAEPLKESAENDIKNGSIKLDGKASRLELKQLSSDRFSWQIKIHEGRNRQIRRTFEEAGYVVKSLHRLSFGGYELEDLGEGEYRQLEI
jgi:23S rRNA pseudouridine2605 synthase